MTETLDALVRRVDEDRWLASRFAPAAARKRLTALYALNYEIARTPETVSNPALGDIKLAWWAEAIEEIYAGKPVRKHPALQAYAEAVSTCALPRGPLDALIEARRKDLDAAPFQTWDEIDAYLDATAGNLMRLAVGCLTKAQDAAFSACTIQAGRAWGYCGLLRASAFWTARGRSPFPQAIDGDEAALRAAMLERGRGAYERARKLAQPLPADLFPAFGYTAFCRSYFIKLERGDDVQTPLLMRQFGLVWVAAMGKV